MIMELYLNKYTNLHQNGYNIIFMIYFEHFCYIPMKQKLFMILIMLLKCQHQMNIDRSNKNGHKRRPGEAPSV